MAKNPTSEFLTMIKSYINQLSDGDRTPNEVASALNGWARESAESVKTKVAEEVEAQVLKMGFIKRSEYEKLVARVEKLEKPSVTKSAAAKPSVKKAATKKVSAEKATAKKASK